MVVPAEISDHQRLVRAPLVSVLMLAYNHCDTLSQAVESVVSQCCAFEFELLIGEDASTDNTLDVAISCQKKYPEIIRIIHSNENVGMNENSSRILRLSRGAYIAYCEGDDYWCCKDKLARQVDIFLSDHQIGAVHSDWVRSRSGSNSGAWVVDWDRSVHNRVDLRLLSGDLFKYFYVPKILRTCTLMVTKKAAEEADSSILRSKHYRFVDTVLAACITSNYKVGYLPDVTSVYRLSKNSALRSGTKARISFLFSALAFDAEARSYFSNRQDYPFEYRWEVCVGIILWSLTIGDINSMRRAFNDIRQHFGIKSFCVAGLRSLQIHFPLVRKNNHKTHMVIAGVSRREL